MKSVFGKISSVIVCIAIIALAVLAFMPAKDELPPAAATESPAGLPSENPEGSPAAETSDAPPVMPTANLDPAHTPNKDFGTTYHKISLWIPDGLTLDSDNKTFRMSETGFIKVTKTKSGLAELAAPTYLDTWALTHGAPATPPPCIPEIRVVSGIESLFVSRGTSADGTAALFIPEEEGYIIIHAVYGSEAEYIILNASLESVILTPVE